MIDFRYRADVDGLRAVAVIMVLLFHADIGMLGGYVGVDVFFVISGFLITGLILKQQRSGTFSLLQFWGRRIRRIIPASTLVGVVCLLAGTLLLPADFSELAKSLTAQQLMVSNIYFWKASDYFGGTAEVMPLLHTWSLAVEEQFYLGYPLVLIVLYRWSTRTAVAVLFAMAAVSLIIAEWGVWHHPTATFYLLPPRACELLLGGLLVYCPEPHRIGQTWRELGSWIGLALVVFAGVGYSTDTSFPGLTAMVPCVGTGLIIYLNTLQPTRLARILSLRPVVFIGMISYSLYLWHWPLFAFTCYWIGIDLPAGQSHLNGVI